MSWCDGEISYLGKLVAMADDETAIVFVDQVNGPARAMKMGMKIMEVPLSHLTRADT